MTNQHDGREGSLRDAVDLANATAGTDTITFSADAVGLHRLTQGEIRITDAVVIEGGGLVTITGDANDDDVTVGATDITDVSASFGTSPGAADDLLNDNSRIFNIVGYSTDTTLSGLTLTGGRTTGDFQAGGAVNSNSPLTIVDSAISGNSTAGVRAFGGGTSSIYVTLTNSTISGNSTAGDNAGGGGISGNYVTLTDSTVSGNSTAGGGSGGGGVSGTRVTLTDSTVSGNSTAGASSRGGGIAGYYEVTLTDSMVTGNSTAGEDADGGGVYGGYDLTLTNSTVSGNSTAGDGAKGGGIYVIDEFYGASRTNLTDSTVSGNSTAGANANGGGLYGGGYVTLANSAVSGNRTTGANASGGGIHAGYDLVLSNSVVDGNSTVGSGAKGGGIFVYADFFPDPSVSLTDSTVSGNSTAGASAHGGGIYGHYDVTLTGSTVSENSTSGDGAAGGGIHGRGDVSLTDSEVKDNSIDGDGVKVGGGGIYSASTVTLTRSVVSGNEIGVFHELARGGGIYGSSAIILTDSSVSGNRILGDYSDGGGIFGYSTIELISSFITGNSNVGLIGSDGGGIYGASSITLTNSTISSNEAFSDFDLARGGGIFGGATVTLINSTLNNNNATVLSDFYASALGGGVYGSDTVKLTNSTVANNGVRGFYTEGGGINGTSILINSTVSGNTSTAIGYFGGSISQAGGISGLAELTNSIVTGNSREQINDGMDYMFNPFPSDVFSSPVLTGRNVVGFDVFSGDVRVGDTTADELFSETQLILSLGDNKIFSGVLADNGGPVQTIALKADTTNPALDAGDDALAPVTDARGVARVDVPGVANNGANISDLGAFEVEVTDLDLAPVIISGGGGVTAAVDAAENQAFVSDLDATDDRDAEGSGLIFSISGGANETLFSIDPDTGEVTFDSAPDFESPTDNDGDGVYEVQVTVTDSGGLTDVQDIAVTVTNINEAPEAEDVVIPVSVDEDTILTEPLGGSALPFSVFATDRDSILALGSFAFLGATIDGVPVAGLSDLGISVDAATGEATFDPTVIAEYQALGTGDLANVLIEFSVTDGEFTDDGTVAFSVTGINDLPAADAISARFNEDDAVQTIELLDPAAVSDVDSVDLDISANTCCFEVGTDTLITRDIDFAVDGETGLLTIDPAQFGDLGASETLAFDLLYAISDGEGAIENRLTITVNGAGGNTAPVFINLPDDGVIVVDRGHKNQHLVLNTDAFDAEGDSFTFSLSGEHPGSLTIAPLTGTLYFKEVFDHALPSFDGDGTFDVTLTVTDIHGASSSRDVEVVLDPALGPDPDPAPVFDNLPAGLVTIDPAAQKNQRLVFQVDADDPQEEAITYSLSGEDAGTVGITPLAGAIFTRGAFADIGPDFDGDGIYEVEVTATTADGSMATEAFAFELI